MSGLSWKSSPCKDFFLKYITIIFQSFNCFLFLHICCFRINIHRCFNICITHNTLNHFQISFIFTKSGAKCVSDMMTRKMRNQYRASALPFCLNKSIRSIPFFLGDDPNIIIQFASPNPSSKSVVDARELSWE